MPSIIEFQWGKHPCVDTRNFGKIRVPRHRFWVKKSVSEDTDPEEIRLAWELVISTPNCCYLIIYNPTE